jgi:hypothetical protein
MLAGLRTDLPSGWVRLPDTERDDDFNASRNISFSPISITSPHQYASGSKTLDRSDRRNQDLNLIRPTAQV